MAGTGSVVRTLSDEALLTGLGSGDPDAAAAFVDRFQRRVSELDKTPVGTVKTRIRTALMRLRSQLGYAMNDDVGCEQVRALAADLAIGIADGQDRDAALRHAAACAECRLLVSELSSVVDDLLLLAPSHEPPAGFASRTLARMLPSSPQPRRSARRALRRTAGRRPWVARLAVAASVAAALALGAGAVYQGTSGDRRLADSYRTVLAQGHGSFFAAAPLKSPTGTLGSVFGYQGQPSWLFATLNQPMPQPEHYEVRLITRDGRHLSLGETVLGGTHRTWGAQIPVNVTQVSQLRFEAASGQSTIIAYLDPRNPWSPG